MRELVEIYKSDKAVSLGMLLCAIFDFFIFADKIYALIAFILSILISTIALKKCYDLRRLKEDKLAGCSFLYCFITNLENNKGTKECYELASKYLVGHFEIKSYDDFINTGIQLKNDDYHQKIITYLCEKERENEIHILNYCETLTELEECNNLIKINLTRYQKNLHKTQLALLFMLLILTLIINLSNVILTTINIPIYNILGLIAAVFFYPALLFDYYWKLKGI